MVIDMIKSWINMASYSSMVAVDSTFDNSEIKISVESCTVEISIVLST